MSFTSNMGIMGIFYTRHALQRMFERSFGEQEVEETIQFGEIVFEYNEDKPYPSKLAMKLISGRPVHVVFACVETDAIVNYIVITVYEPSIKEWNEDFKTRRI